MNLSSPRLYMTFMTLLKSDTRIHHEIPKLQQLVPLNHDMPYTYINNALLACKYYQNQAGKQKAGSVCAEYCVQMLPVMYESFLALCNCERIDLLFVSLSFNISYTFYWSQMKYKSIHFSTLKSSSTLLHHHRSLSPLPPFLKVSSLL